MKNAFTKAISILLVAVMVFGAAPLAGFVGLDLPDLGTIFATKAKAATYSGTCGQNLTWVLDESTGELVVSGTGAMYNYSSSSYSPKAPWYYESPAIKRVTISDGVTSIGRYAFYDCDSLECVIIGNSVTNIGEYAFGYCGSLVSVKIPDSVTSIGDCAFLSCDSLTSLYYPGTPEQWKNISVGISGIIRRSIIFECNSEKPYHGGFCGESLNWKIYVGSTELIISGTGAMADYSSAYISFGTYATTAPWGDFFSSIKSVTIPDSVTTIGNSAFYGCTSLSSVTIPDSVTTIGSSAFRDCKNLIKVNIPFGISEINSYTFYGCLSITKIVIPNSVTTIGESAFNGCDSLESITIPDGVKSIGSDAFYDCDKLESVSLGNNVKTIGEDAFYGCGSLKSITIPSSVEEMPSAFEYCTNLENVQISNGVTTISDNAFSRCWNLTTVTIPDSVESIKLGAFEDCNDITDVYYSGSKSEWEQILIGGENDDLTSAKIHYNYIWNGNGGSTETPEIPDNTPDYDSSVVDTFLIPTPTEKTISYGDSIILHMDPSKIPDGGKVEWYPSNGNFSYSVSKYGTICTITPEKSGDTTFTALVYDAEGNIVSADTQVMTSKAGFFQKIIAFFKKLFGLTKTIPEAFKGIY